MKTLSQIKSNVAVPIKKKVLFCFTHKHGLSYWNWSPTFPLFQTSEGFEVLLGFPSFVDLLFLSTCPIQYSPAFQVKENKEKERLERRLLDELYKIFMDSDSFYYSMTYDLTNSVQRQGDSDKSDMPLWKQVWSYWSYFILLMSTTQTPYCGWLCFYSVLKVDDRFFWNKHMIQELIDLQVLNTRPTHLLGNTESVCLVLLFYFQAWVIRIKWKHHVLLKTAYRVIVFSVK